MRARTYGKVTMAVLTFVFGAVTIWMITKVEPDAMYQGYRAVAWGILALTTATVLRFFED